MRKGLLWTRLLAAAVCLGALGLGAASALGRQGIPIPVLMYHHFVTEGPVGADTVVSAQRFEEQIRALQEGGYTAVTLQQLLDYVDRKAQLPPKPILITIDDGYTSNLTIAAPVLERYGMKATILVIGIYVGQSLHPHSGQPIDLPRFGWEEARPWVEKGVLTIQSHTYDMHQRVEHGFSGRDGVLRLPGESDEAYRAALDRDFAKARDELERGLGVPMTALAFPFGLDSPQAVEELEKLGVRVTFTTDYGCSRAVPGRKDCTQRMKRWWIRDDITGAQLLKGLENLEKGAKAPLF